MKKAPEYKIIYSAKTTLALCIEEQQRQINDWALLGYSPESQSMTYTPKPEGYYILTHTLCKESEENE